jgi:hypothetical protein
MGFLKRKEALDPLWCVLSLPQNTISWFVSNFWVWDRGIPMPLFGEEAALACRGPRPFVF